MNSQLIMISTQPQHCSSCIGVLEAPGACKKHLLIEEMTSFSQEAATIPQEQKRDLEAPTEGKLSSGHFSVCFPCVFTVDTG